MVGDLVHLSSALRSRLTRLGANVPHATAAARVPNNGEVTTEQFFDFWEALGASSPLDTGLRLATETQVHEYDVSSLAALHSPDVETALPSPRLQRRQRRERTPRHSASSRATTSLTLAHRAGRRLPSHHR